MGVIAPFDLAYFQATYPEFDYVGQDQLAAYFNMASELHSNRGGGLVNDQTTQQFLVHLMLAHITKLFAVGPTDQAGNTTPAPEIVGRISAATEGSVHVDTENNYPPGTVQWYQQTKYGSMYWVATTPLRSGTWIPGRLPTRPGMGPAWQYPQWANWRGSW